MASRVLSLLLAGILAVPSHQASAAAPHLPESPAPPGLSRGPSEVTPEMRTWLRSKKIARAPSATRLRLLAKALIDHFELHRHEEEPFETVSASRAFEAGRGNCVSFAFLFVSLAREVGEPVFFVLSEAPEGNESFGDLLVTNFHLAAATGTPARLTVFDLAGRSSQPTRPFRPISDRTADAIFQSNQGSELLIQDRLTDALRLFDSALVLDPALPFTWTNRGVALRRLGDLGKAEASYRQAIDLRPEALAAWKNLALLLGQRLQEQQTSLRIPR
ncbi:MAG: tetratricopeptide repeat protein [Deltaproteobacteria bacterium]|nr:tetratricopeptide repeat protein [Deltaproteobacteria bacterium]